MPWRKRADEALSAKEHSLRQAREGLQQLARKLLHTQEEERSRIAREMHDDWTQRLAILGLDAARLEEHLGSQELALPLLRAMRERLISLAEDVHALSRQLHPAILDDLGLVEALRSECTNFSRREGIAIQYVPENVPDELSKEVALCIYRAAQEALRNLAKHAAVNVASVKISCVGPELILEVRDQGVGFDWELGALAAGAWTHEHERTSSAYSGRAQRSLHAWKGDDDRGSRPYRGVHCMSRARVLIADDHQILAEGVRSLLEPEFEVVGVVLDGQALVAAAKELRTRCGRDRRDDAIAERYRGSAAAASGSCKDQSCFLDDASRHRLRTTSHGSWRGGLCPQTFRFIGIGHRYSRGTVWANLYLSHHCGRTSAVLP